MKIHKIQSVIIIATLQSFKQIQHLKPEKRVYCRTCDKFVINPKDRANHNGHDLAENIEDAMLENPIQGILNPVELNAKNAVNFYYLFIPQIKDINPKCNFLFL